MRVCKSEFEDFAMNQNLEIFYLVWKIAIVVWKKSWKGREFRDSGRVGTLKELSTIKQFHATKQILYNTKDLDDNDMVYIYTNYGDAKKLIELIGAKVDNKPLNQSVKLIWNLIQSLYSSDTIKYLLDKYKMFDSDIEQVAFVAQHDN